MMSRSRKFGANFIVRGGAYEVMEGQARDRNVVVEFKDHATAKACYDSAEYQAARAIRQKYADADFIMLITAKGMMIMMSVGDIRVIGRATQGVTLMNLGEGDKLAGLSRIAEAESEEESE